jgi:hypothetical protein
MYFLMQKVANNENAGLIAAMCYMASPYLLLNLTVQVAVGEFWGMAFAPLLFLGLCGGLVIAGAVMGQLEFHYYPAIGGADFNAWQASLFTIYFALCGLPLWVRGKEASQWKRALRARA